MHTMNASIAITTDRDVNVTTRKRISGTDVNVKANFNPADGDAVTLSLHPETGTAYHAIVEKLTDPVTYDNRSTDDGTGPVVWTSGEVLPGVMVTVFVPYAMRKEVTA